MYWKNSPIPVSLLCSTKLNFSTTPPRPFPVSDTRVSMPPHRSPTNRHQRGSRKPGHSPTPHHLWPPNPTMDRWIYATCGKQLEWFLGNPEMVNNTITQNFESVPTPEESDILTEDAELKLRKMRMSLFVLLTKLSKKPLTTAPPTFILNPSTKPKYATVLMANSCPCASPTTSSNSKVPSSLA